MTTTPTQLPPAEDTIYQQAQRIQEGVTAQMLQLLDDGASRAMAVLDTAKRQAELAMGLTAMRQRSEMVGKLLEHLEAERAALTQRMEQSKSPALKKYLQLQLKALSEKEESILTAFDGGSMASSDKQLTDKQSAVVSATAE